MCPEPADVSERKKLHLKPSIKSDSLSAYLPYETRFKIAVDAGIEGLEIDAVKDREELHHIHAAALTAGLKIHTVETPLQWQFPLSSRDSLDIKLGVKAIVNALDNAKVYGADTVVIIPGLVNATTSYEDAYRRSQQVIKNEILPIAEQYSIVLAIENVWNGILLSPFEYTRYIDEFESPFVRSLLDLGNMIHGHPEYWIPIVGSRIHRLHVKDYSFEHKGNWLSKGRCGEFSIGRLGQGKINWQAVSDALRGIGYSGWATSAEIRHGLLARGLERGMTLLRRHEMDRLPILESVMDSVLKRALQQSLDDVSRRFGHFLQ